MGRKRKKRGKREERSMIDESSRNEEELREVASGGGGGDESASRRDEEPACGDSADDRRRDAEGGDGGDEVEELRRRVARLEEELALKQEQLLRLAADFDNYKKRAQREMEREIVARTDAILSKFLPVLDSFEKALEHAEGEGELDQLKEGVRHIYEQMMAVMREFGVEPLEVEGEAFDPNIHEAIMRCPPQEGLETDTVVLELMRGYKVGDRMLRYPKVGVAPPAGEQDADHGSGKDESTEGGEASGASEEES